MPISVFEEAGDVFVYETASHVVYEVFSSHEAGTWDQLAAAIQFHHTSGQQRRVHPSLIKSAYRYGELLGRLGVVKPTAVWDGSKVELKCEPGPATKAFLSNMLPPPQSQTSVMKFKVSIEVPGSPPREKPFENVLKPLAGKAYDSMSWGTGDEDSYILWFESEKPDLAIVLQQALVAGTIWSYSIRVFKQKGQSEQGAREGNPCE